MPTVLIKRSSLAAAAPLASQLVAGELALNTTDEKLYFLNAGGVVKVLAGSTTAASAITNTPAGNISATTVQAAINELDGAKLSNAAGAVPTASLAADAVTYAKLQNVSATDRLLGRVTAGAGDAEEIVCTPFARTLLDDATQAAALTTLGTALNATVALTALYTVVAADRGKLFDCTSGTFTITLTAAATLGSGFSFAVRNSGTGVITLDPDAAELVDGVATIALAAGQSCLVTCNGAAFKTVGLAVASAPNGAFRSMQVFTASGTYTKPAGLVRAKITVVGGGGGGGGDEAGTGGAGGGGGGTAIRVLAAASIGATETVTVGGGGAGGGAGVNGASGGTSSMGTLASATGGAGGLFGASSANSAGTGGIGSSGNLNLGGGTGGTGGGGGDSYIGSGGKVGQAGLPFGGGGAGSLSAAGLVGAAGVVFVEEYF